MQEKYIVNSAWNAPNTEFSISSRFTLIVSMNMPRNIFPFE